jgi:cellulose biosynthesis protein BcsQ
MPVIQNIGVVRMSEFLNGLGQQTVASIIATPIANAVRYVGESVFKNLMSSSRSEERLKRAATAIGDDSPGIWLTPSIEMPENYEISLKSSKPILVVCNNKGGVGKTTIAANLAAFFARERRQRVLTIDLDFQGSLSSMMVPGERAPLEGLRCKASELISGELTSSKLLHVASKYDGVSNLWCVSAFFDLAQMENRVMIGWLIGDNPPDIRYTLAKLLHSKSIQENYDRIIIDAPPRLTAACVQALCAGTHVLIPTILDEMSYDGAINFIRQVRELRQICPYIKHLGVAASKVVPNQNYDNELAELKRQLSRLKQKYGSESPDAPDVIEEHFIYYKPMLSRGAGKKVVFADASKNQETERVRGMFRRLGAEIEKRERAER